MSRQRRGQSQVITAVLLGGILIAGISAAYIWGLPILQKNQDVNNAQQSLTTLKDLASGLGTVATQGGSRSISVSLGTGSLDIDADNETLTYRALTRGAYVSTEDWVPLNENDMQGVNRSTGDPVSLSEGGYAIRGSDSPALLIGRAILSQERFTTFYRIVLRPLYETGSDQTYQIDLVQNGNLQVSGGQHTVVFQRIGEETLAGEGVNGGTLHRIQVSIRVS